MTASLNGGSPSEVSRETQEVLDKSGSVDLDALNQEVEVLVNDLSVFINGLVKRKAYGASASEQEVLVGEVLFRAWRGIHEGVYQRERGSLKTWLAASIVRSVVRDYHRTKKQSIEDAVDDFDEYQLFTRGVSTEDVVVEHENRNEKELLIDWIWEMCALEPHKTQKVIHLRYHDNLPFKQIAEQMGVPSSTVRAIARRFTQKVRSLVSDRRDEQRLVLPRRTLRGC